MHLLVLWPCLKGQLRLTEMADADSVDRQQVSEKNLAGCLLTHQFPEIDFKMSICSY